MRGMDQSEKIHQLVASNSFRTTQIGQFSVAKGGLMLLHEDLLALAKQQVEQTHQLVFRQREVIRNLQAAGLETKVNEDVLRMFERLLAKSEDNHARLSRDRANPRH